MEKRIIDRKSITLKKGEIHTENLTESFNTGDVSYLIEHDFNGYHRRVLLDIGERGLQHKHRSIVLNSGMQKETFNDHEFNADHFNFNKIELSTDEPQLIISFSVLLEQGEPQ